jgi:fumarate reductase subunit D
VLAVVLLVPGVLAVFYGDEVSQALSNIAAGTISRLMGTLLVVGSVLTLTGIARNRTLTETFGLTVTAIGCAIYGLGVMLGLGLHGAVAGSGFLAIAAATIRRVITLAAVAREVDRAGES